MPVYTFCDLCGSQKVKAGRTGLYVCPTRYHPRLQREPEIETEAEWQERAEREEFT